MKKSNVGSDVTVAEVKLKPINETIRRTTESPPGRVAALELQIPSTKFQRNFKHQAPDLARCLRI